MTDQQLLRDILHYCVDEYSLPTIQLRFKPNQRSKVRYHTLTGQYTITVATGWFLRGDELSTATLLHEIAHIMQHVQSHRFSHDQTFKDYERRLLADFGLQPVGYSRAYYYQLQSINGSIVWNR